MPNWCFTRIIIKDSKDITDFYNKIKEWTSKNYIENSFGNNWLGNIVGFSGIASWKEDYGFVPSIECRGSLCSLELEDNHTIQLETETAWDPMIEMWRILTNKYLSEDAEIFWTAEEEGCELFLSNDPDVVGTYYVDVIDPPFDDEEKLNVIEKAFGDYEGSFYVDKYELVNSLKKLLESSKRKVDTLLSEFKDSEWSDYINIHMYEYSE